MKFGWNGGTCLVAVQQSEDKHLLHHLQQSEPTLTSPLADWRPQTASYRQPQSSGRMLRPRQTSSRPASCRQNPPVCKQLRPRHCNSQKPWLCLLSERHMLRVTGWWADGKLLADYWLPEMDIVLIGSQQLCFADSAAQKLTPHFTYLESCCVFSHWLYYSRALKARDERRFWRIINIPLAYHQVQKIQATATKNWQFPPLMFVDVRYTLIHNIEGKHASEPPK